MQNEPVFRGAELALRGVNYIIIIIIIQKRYIKLTGTMHTLNIMGTSQRKEAMIWKHVTLFIIL